jgi:hypothetical protein
MWVGGQRHTPAALPLGKTRYPLYRKLGGPQGRSERVRKISPPPPTGIRFRTVQPVARRYNVWAIPAHDAGPLKIKIFPSSIERIRGPRKQPWASAGYPIIANQMLPTPLSCFFRISVPITSGWVFSPFCALDMVLHQTHTNSLCGVPEERWVGTADRAEFLQIH